MVNVIPLTAPPLILLVHGTWGTKSTWTFPGASLRDAISKQYGDGVQIDRQPWSGRNSPYARRSGTFALKARLEEEFNTAPRQVVLICHSHGGNIAIQARDLLNAEYQHLVTIITMGTPFLDEGRKFFSTSSLDRLPEDKLNILLLAASGALMLGACFLLVQLGIAAGIISGILAPWFQVPSAAIAWILYPACLLLLVFSVFRVISWINVLPISSNSESMERHKHDLSITYSQDEVFEALSIIINLISMMYLLIFTAGRIIFNLLNRWNPIGWVAAIAVLVYYTALGIIVFSLIIQIIIAIVIPKSILPSWLTGVIEGARESAHDIGFQAIIWIFINIGFLSLILVLAVSVVLLTALIRFAVLYTIGVVDMARSQRELLDLVVGSLSVSMVPQGSVQSVQMRGSARFNHTAIYDDKRAIASIVERLDLIIGSSRPMSEVITQQRP